MDSNEINTERKFLHDLINYITKAHGRIKINALKIKSNQNPTLTEIEENEAKAIEALDELIGAINKRRTDITSLDNFVPDEQPNFENDED